MLRGRSFEADNRQHEVKRERSIGDGESSSNEDGCSGEEDNINQGFCGYEGTCPENDQDPADPVHG